MVKIHNCKLHLNDFIKESVLLSFPFLLSGHTSAFAISGLNHMLFLFGSCCSWEAQLLQFPEQGCHSQGKFRPKHNFFKIREKSGNFASS